MAEDAAAQPRRLGEVGGALFAGLLRQELLLLAEAAQLPQVVRLQLLLALQSHPFGLFSARVECFSFEIILLIFFSWQQMLVTVFKEQFGFRTLNVC